MGIDAPGIFALNPAGLLWEDNYDSFRAEELPDQAQTRGPDRYGSAFRYRPRCLARHAGDIGAQRSGTQATGRHQLRQQLLWVWPNGFGVVRVTRYLRWSPLPSCRVAGYPIEYVGWGAKNEPQHRQLGFLRYPNLRASGWSKKIWKQRSLIFNLFKLMMFTSMSSISSTILSFMGCF